MLRLLRLRLIRFWFRLGRIANQDTSKLIYYIFVVLTLI